MSGALHWLTVDLQGDRQGASRAIFTIWMKCRDRAQGFILQKNFAGDRCPDAQRNPCYSSRLGDCRRISSLTRHQLSLRVSQDKMKIESLRPLEICVCNYDSKGKEALGFLSFPLIRVSIYWQALAQSQSPEIPSSAFFLLFQQATAKRLFPIYRESYTLTQNYSLPTVISQWNTPPVEARRPPIRVWIVTVTTSTT